MKQTMRTLKHKNIARAKNIQKWDDEDLEFYAEFFKLVKTTVKNERAKKTAKI